jgi:pimeloyl-ACP methyl ester carboxylesterase
LTDLCFVSLRPTIVAVLLALAPAMAFQTAFAEGADQPTVAAPASRPVASGRVRVNGVKYYYEVHGKGEPLLMLHGGMGSIEMFEPGLPAFAEHRQVIAVDLHGHGRTPLGNRRIDPVDMGDDMAMLLKKLGYGPVDVIGYSMGGAVAFRLAVQHPQNVRRLVLVSQGYAQEGFHPELLPMQAQVGAAMAESMKESPMYKSYAAIAPNPAEFPKLLDRMGEWLRRPYNWEADVKTLTMPVMLVYGDSDMFRPEHEIKFYQLLGGGLRDAGWQREHMSGNRLAILPNRTHYEMSAAPELVPLVLPFIDGKTAPGSSRGGD